MNKYTTMILLVLITGCASSPKNAEPVLACGVTFGFIVNPQSELTKFKLFLPPRCSDRGVEPELSEAWKKTACAHFSTYKLTPTYAEGEQPKMLYQNYFYRPKRPNVLYPNVNSGSSEKDPVIYVKESILEPVTNNTNHVCEGNLEASTEPSA